MSFCGICVSLWTHWPLEDVGVILEVSFLNSQNSSSGIRFAIALRWMSQNLTDKISTVGQVVAWWRQATSHDLSQNCTWCPSHERYFKIGSKLKRSSLKCALSTTTKCYTRHDSVTLMTCAIFRCGQPNMLSINTLRNFTAFRIRLKYVSWTGPRFMSPFDATSPQWVTGKTALVHQKIFSNFDWKINSHQLTYINLTCCDVNAKNAYFSSVA